MTDAKICGLRDRSALDAALDHGARWVGFVFFPASPRAITVAEAAPLARVAGGRTSRVGLFVRPEWAELDAVLSAVELDALQIYDEPERALALRRHANRPVWLARGVSNAGELPTTCSVDGLVIEAKPPPGATRPGGHGAMFDWSLTRNWTAPVPWMLAGGLRPDNVADAIAVSGAPAVDVSSGVESAPGHKDPALIGEFLAAVRGAVPAQ